MKTQNSKNDKKAAKPASKKQGAKKELSQEELKSTNGGSIGLLDGISSLTSELGGTAGLNSSSSGTGPNGQSYSSNNNNQANAGLGGVLGSQNF